jgi:hypothetical protein
LSVFLIVSDEAREGLTTLLPLLGAIKKQAVWIWNEKAEALGESIRQAISDRKPWSIYEAGTPGNERLIRVSEMVAEQLQEQNEAALDLEVRMVTIAEVLAVAEGMGLPLTLVAILKPSEGAPLPLLDHFDRELVETIRLAGGTASISQIAGIVQRDPIFVRKRLKVLAAFHRIVATGSRGSSRYSLPQKMRNTSECMSRAKNTNHPTVVEISDSVTSFLSGMKLLRHVRGCEECQLEYSRALRRSSDGFIFDFWIEEGLSERVAGVLAGAGIFGLPELKAALLGKIPGIGRKGAEEIRQLLDDHKEGDSD